MNEFTPRDSSEPAAIDPDQIARDHLDRGERLVWTGQPVAALAMKRGFKRYPFAILWTVFSVFWVVMAYSATRHSSLPDGHLMSYLFPLFGMPFVMLGLFMFYTPFLLRNQAKKIVYAITDQRALIINPALKEKEASYYYHDWDGELTCTVTNRGYGNITFPLAVRHAKDDHLIMMSNKFIQLKRKILARREAREKRIDDEVKNKKSVRHQVRIAKNGFEYVKDVQEVERKLRRALSNYKAQQGAGSTTS